MNAPHLIVDDWARGGSQPDAAANAHLASSADCRAWVAQRDSLRGLFDSEPSPLGQRRAAELRFALERELRVSRAAAAAGTGVARTDDDRGAAASGAAEGVDTAGALGAAASVPGTDADIRPGTPQPPRPRSSWPRRVFALVASAAALLLAVGLRGWLSPPNSAKQPERAQSAERVRAGALTAHQTTPTPQPTGEDETRNAAPNEQPPVSPQPQPDPVLTAHDPTTVTADAAPRALRATSLDSDARVPTLDDVSAEAPEDDAPVTPEQAFDQRFLAAWRMRATDPSGAAFALDVLISSHSTPANRRPELMLHSAYAHRAAGELQAASRRLAQYLERFPGSPRAARVRQELRALRSGVAKPEDTPER